MNTSHDNKASLQNTAVSPASLLSNVLKFLFSLKMLKQRRRKGKDTDESYTSTNTGSKRFREQIP